MAESILDQLQTIPEEEPAVEKKKPKKSMPKKDSPEMEEKREQLSILTVLGTIETYTGAYFSLGEVKKLTAKDVEKYYNRYQITLGNQVTGGLVDTVLETGVELVSYVLPIDNKNELYNDLKSNELVKITNRT